MAPEVAQGLRVPLIDSVTSGARALVAAAHGPRGAAGAASVARLGGLSSELTLALQR